MTILTIKVTTRAKQDKIVSWEEGVLHVRLKAIPEKGNANKALVKLLSRELSIPQQNIVLLLGATSRLKRVEIEGLSLDEMIQIIKKTR